MKRELLKATLALMSATLTWGQPVGVTALTPALVQSPGPSVTVDTSGRGVALITHAGSSGTLSLELPSSLAVVPCSQGGGSCLPPTEVRVRHTLTGFRQVSIKVNLVCTGPVSGFGFVSDGNFTCPILDARLDSQNQVGINAVVTLQKSVGDPTPVINLSFRWQVALPVPSGGGGVTINLQSVLQQVNLPSGDYTDPNVLASAGLKIVANPPGTLGAAGTGMLLVRAVQPNEVHPPGTTNEAFLFGPGIAFNTLHCTTLNWTGNGSLVGFTITRPGVLNGASIPAWAMFAYDAAGNQLDTKGEGNLSSGNFLQPSNFASFTLSSTTPIARVAFCSHNASSTYNALPLSVSNSATGTGGGTFIGIWTSPTLGTVVITPGSGSLVNGSFTGSGSIAAGTFTGTVTGTQCGGTYITNSGGTGLINIVLSAGATGFTGTLTPTGGSPIPVSATTPGGGGGTGGSGNCGINITSDTSSATANLSTEGTADWVTIGLDPIAADNCPAGTGKPTCTPKERKAGVTPLIGPLQMIGGADTYVNYYGNDQRRLSWTGTDATVPTVTSNGAGVYVEHGGYSISAPADTITRTFILHAGTSLEQVPMTLTARLSDGSAPDQIIRIPAPSAPSDFNFKIVYQASKASQLTVIYQQDDPSPAAYLTFSGAALSAGGTVTGTCAGSGGGTGGTPKIAVSTTTLDFGNVSVGQTPPAELTLNVSSAGTAPLTLSSLTIQNSAFTLVSPPQMPYTIGDAALQLRVRFAPTAAGPQSGTLKIASNDPDPTRSVVTISLSGTVTTGGQTGCSYDVRPTSLNDITGSGSSGVFLISTAPGCAWTTTVPDTAKSWVTLSPSSGTGSGGVGYTLAANTGAPRNTTLTVATVPIAVQQAGGSSCTYSLDSTAREVSGIQGGFGITVAVSGTGCAPWTVSIPSTAGWIHPGSAVSSFTGTNTAIFVVDPNPGPLARTATVTISTPAGARTVTLTQDAPPCTYALSPLSSATIPPDGTAGLSLSAHIGVTGAVCAWSVSAPGDANSQWVHITSAASATSSGDVNYTADANNTTSPRSVTLTITGLNPSTKILYTINQAPGAQNTGPVPVISPGGVVNAASFIPANLPGGAIAQGSFFSIFGTRLGPTPSVQANQYPLDVALGNVSVKVTQGSITVNALPVFVAQFQVNAVMPSNAPTGDVQVTVTFNGATSAPAPAKIVVSNFGAFAVSGGRGPGIVQNVISQTLRPLNASNGPATPGQYVTLWGTGLGPLPNGASDSQPPAAGVLPIPVKVFVGGKIADSKAQFFYSGRGPGLAGIDQFNFQLPADVPLGCYVPVQVQVADTFYSNTVSMAISSDGSACNDQNPLSTRARTGGRNGSVTLIRLNLTDSGGGMATGSIDLGMAGFSQKAAGGDLGFDLFSSLPPLNSCTYYNNLESLNGVLGLQLPSQGSPDSIDAGSSISVKGAKGTQGIPYSDASTAKSPYLGLFGGSGTVGLLAPGGPFLDPGSYAISGPGGKDVGPFSFTMNVPAGVTWTNRDQIFTIDRAQPLTINWSGGNPAAQVGLILGFSTNPSTKVSGGFACLAPLDAGSFAVQPGNMANLPASAANAQSKLIFITVPRADQAVKFTTSAAPNLDNGLGIYALGDMRTVTFK